MKKYRTRVVALGEITYASQHIGDKGGVNIYTIKEVEEWKDRSGEVKRRTHSFLMKQFFMAGYEIELIEKGTNVEVFGYLKTTSKRLGEDSWETTAFIDIVTIKENYERDLEGE